jgi:hypothetical protein
MWAVAPKKKKRNKLLLILILRNLSVRDRYLEFREVTERENSRTYEFHELS